MKGQGKSSHVTVRSEDKIEDVRRLIENDWLFFSEGHLAVYLAKPLELFTGFSMSILVYPKGLPVGCLAY